MATAVWSHVSVACVPDDTGPTTRDRYDAIVFDPDEHRGGFIRFQGLNTGDLFFWCNVVSPVDMPTWTAMWVTFRDANPDGFIEVRLYQKAMGDGATELKATFTSSDVIGVVQREAQTYNHFGFDFANNTYFMRIQLHRSETAGRLEFHSVSLCN